MLIFWLWSIVAVAVAVNTSVALVMKLRVNDRLLSKEKPYWWFGGYRKLVREYSEIYPDSHLTLIAQWSWWLLWVMFPATMVVSMVRGSRTEHSRS
jgi:hypothetical protein